VLSRHHDAIISNHHDVTSGPCRRHNVPGEIDGTIKVDDDRNGVGYPRNCERKKDTENVEVSLTEKETMTGTRDNASV